MRTRHTVIAELKNAVTEERKSTTRVLHLLLEIEHDKHFLEMGYPSLFEFATKELAYSAGSAMRRIQAMRLLKIMPEIENKIEDGSLSLCVAAKAQSFFRNEDLLRNAGSKLQFTEKRETINMLEGLSLRECEKKLAELSPSAAIPKEKTQPLTSDKTLIQFIADQKLLDKIETLKNLLAHQNYNGTYEKLFDLLADLALKKLDPEKLTRQTKKTPVVILTKHEQEKITKPTEKKHSRYLSKEVRREVWLRDKGRCSYYNSSMQKRCESKHALEFDHEKPFSHNGPNTVENLSLKCSAHHRLITKQQGFSRYIPRDRGIFKNNSQNNFRDNFFGNSSAGMKK